MQSMENRRYSRDNKRKSSNDSHQLDIISDYQVEDLDESSASDTSNKIHKKIKKIPLTRSKTTYDNVNKIINKKIDNDEEDTDENVESFRGNFTYTEEKSDENTSDNVDIKKSNKKNLQILDKKKKCRRTKRQKLQDDNITTIRKNSEENIDKNRYTMNKRHSSSSKNNDSSDRSVRRSKKKKKQTKEGGGGDDGVVEDDDDVDQHEELPITEILRKAQENSRIQYEEPTPLPQLTTDTIYIQGRNGFSSFKIPNNTNKKRHDPTSSLEPVTYPIEVAIFTQKIWKNFGLVCQGLLAGISLMHFLLIQKFFKFNLAFYNDYSAVSEIYTNLFSLLILICIISAFDKYDLAHLNLTHFNEIYDNHSKSIIAVPLYVVVFFLHQINLALDDKLSIISYTTNEANNTMKVWSITAGEIETWKTLTLTKNGISVLAWLFISLGPEKDMLLSHLQSLKKYIDNNN
ncbi:uncharacterized protein LOC122859030 isoform X2 [Aphidius gifuensis]|uniref:uncharacterized protein LOC122859030 isoform X2 n=1 Tax=Aphidius gifuensis TaxID=684658 RepID=UPI001CDD0DD9|nr:uncharacterized protein LOC122859030 isoform X2 [Aphidius gifuensis]